MDTKTRLLYMLSTRDPPQNKEHKQTKSEGVEKNISRKRRPKERDGLNGYKNKTPIYVVYKRPALKQETHTD